MTMEDPEPDGEADHPLARALAVRARKWKTPSVEAGPLAPGFVPFRRLLADDGLLERMLARQGAATPGLDRKGQAAYLMTGLAGGIGMIAAALFVGSGLVARLGPDHIAHRPAQAGEDGEASAAWRLLHHGFATDLAEIADHPDAEPAADRDALADRLREELEAHFAPVVERLHAATALPQAALWRLAGDAVAGWFLEAGRRFGREAEARVEAMRVLKRPGAPLTNREMHYFDLAIADPAHPGRTLLTRAFRARGGCCRWYTATDGKLCTTCVLRSDADRRATIEASIRRRLGLPPATEPLAP